MRFISSFLVGLIAILMSSASFAGLVVHTTELGVGKFHRADNKVHPYGATHAWLPYVLPDGAMTDKPIVQKNADGSFTIFFSTLDDMMASVIQLSQSENQKVSVLNVHGHGLPGAMWFPKDAQTLAAWECSDWRDAASGSDDDNYNQYYTPVSVDEIMQMRQISDAPDVHPGCTTGLQEWQEAVAKTPQFKTVFAPDAQLHFASCIVGLGSVGLNFTQGIAQLLLPQGAGRVETSMAFGLGDWSMPTGMGFWDYQTDDQVKRDDSLYPVDHKDAEIAQKGSIRLATFANGQWTGSAWANRDVMFLGFDPQIRGTRVVEQETLQVPFATQVPQSVRIPGTNVRARIEQR